MTKKFFPQPTTRKLHLDKVELSRLRDRITELVGKSPDKAAIILTDWLKRPAKNQTLKKKAG